MEGGGEPAPAATVMQIQEVLLTASSLDHQAVARQLTRLLKSLQHSLQQTRTSAAADSRLLPCLQSLLCFGWDAEATPSSPRNLPSSSTSTNAITGGNGVITTIKERYLPPGARSYRPSLGSASDSDASDAERGQESVPKASRVRFLALVNLQLVIKADPRAVHPSWTMLLPQAATNIQKAAGAVKDVTLAHLLLLDPSARVRHASAVTLGTMLEGPAQRAYLQVAEHRGKKKDSSHSTPVRGYVPLSAALGAAVVGAHEALLRVLSSEQDASVVAAALRALGTVLLGAPYARMPSALLPQCVEAAWKVAQGGLVAQAPESAAPLVAGSLSCLAAAFGVKPPLSSLSDFLVTDDRGVQLAGDLLEGIRHSSASVQLEALMALRGLTQQYYSSIATRATNAQPLRAAVLEMATRAASFQHTGAEAYALAPPLSFHSEKVAQQAVLLAGDWARQDCDTDVWEEAMRACFAPALCHDSGMLRAAALASIVGVKPGVVAGLACAELMETACAMLERDPASPVRAAAARAVASLLAAAEDLQLLEKVAPALVAASGDEVLAVRIQAAAAVAGAADLLLAAAQRLADGTNGAIFLSALKLLFPVALRLTSDGDKVKPAGVLALGSLLAARTLRDRALAIDDGFHTSLGALRACLASENAKVQWSACIAAGRLIGAAGQDNTPALQPLIDDMRELAASSANSRTRSLAEQNTVGS